MRSLRILIGSDQAPLPEGSAAGRCCFALIEGLAAKGHRVTAIAACQSDDEAQAIRACFRAPGSDVRCFIAAPRSKLASKMGTLRRPHSYPFSQAAVHEWRAECARGYDIAQLEGTWSGWLTAGMAKPRMLLDIHNLYCIDWEEDESRGWQERARRTLSVRAERQLIRSFPNLLTVTGTLAGELARMAPRSAVHVVPLALDLKRYEFVPREKRPSNPVVAMIGSMTWPSSKSAAERLLGRLWPEIRKGVPDARLQITGKRARSVLQAYLGVPGVEIHEDVASMQPYFENASLLLYTPERGSGMKVKVLEAFAYGVPVVTTVTGIEGLEVEDGVHAGIHENDEGLIDRVLRLLREPERQESQRRAARRLVEAKHAPAAVIGQLENLYAKLLEERDVRAGRGVTEHHAGCR